MIGMTALSSANALIAGKTRPAATPRPMAVELTSLASGILSQAPGSEKSEASRSIYSVNHVDVNKLKISLMERVGKAFGLEFGDFKDSAALARAIKPIFERMEHASVMAVEKSLGLDELGVSLRTVLDAMANPGGEADNELAGALLEAAGETLDRAGRHAGLDEIGRYSRESAR